MKRFFGKSSAPSKRESLSIEDLVVLERYEEAIEQLEARIKSNPRDLHSSLRLAEVYTQAGMGGKALDTYLFVADSYAEDGFYDKALALLAKLARLAPADDTLAAKVAWLQRMKTLEHSRAGVVDGLLSGQAGLSPLERTSPVEAQKVWQGLTRSKLVQTLPPEQLRRLFSAVAIQDWNPGEMVAERGSQIERMFVVSSGSIEAFVAHPESGAKLQIRTFSNGDVLGERALLEHKPWPATYRVLERARVLRIDRAGLEKALTGNPDPRTLLAALRLQHADQDVASAAEKLLASPG
ncbi:MAG: cyclic nucleotide-binding domain-containing protein [Acidobacteria bacterium]|nr:cyclic nucleotide-binding domain-containing protein [Acidobacteriota bacterium]